MSSENESSNIEREPESSDELSSEELDQVVGGTDPKPAPVKYIEIKLETVTISSVQTSN